MTFEETCKEYLTQLKTNGIILEGDLYGINEVNEIGKAKVSILEADDSVSEKFIIVFKSEGNTIWKFLKPKDQIDYEYNPDENGWGYSQYSKRIVAPLSLIMDDIGIKMYGWFTINDLPVKKLNETTVHLYCNVILPEHQAIVDSLGGAITIEDRPV